MTGIPEILDLLHRRNIPHTMVEHEAVYTIEEMERHGLNARGEVAKNLFLRDQKGKRHFLVVLRGDKTADLKSLQASLGCTKLSFASEERLMKHLGLQKGAVTPLGVLNDTQAAVEVVVDRDLTELEQLGVHPDTNTATVFLSARHLLDIVEENGNRIHYVEI